MRPISFEALDGYLADARRLGFTEAEARDTLAVGQDLEAADPDVWAILWALDALTLQAEFRALTC